MFSARCLLLLLLWPASAFAQRSVLIGEGWARTKVNAVIFRHHAVCSHGDQQVASWYDAEGRVLLARRTLGSDRWETRVTPFRGKTTDAHNAISIAFDGDGRLHMSWDHHGNPLRYCREVRPGSLEMGPIEPMVGTREDRVTYPEFYQLPDGDLLCFYRDGGSGNGNLVLNRYDVKSSSWRRVHDNLIDGQGQRNAYWQVAIDPRGFIHLSWVWRETGDVRTNHDIAYACSQDGGQTWQKTTGDRYDVPINEQSAEYAIRIPQDSELANQTSMAVDARGRPVIANFWRDNPDAVPQYRLVRYDGTRWTTRQVGQRTLNFHRRGGGTKKPPVSRPVILLRADGDRTQACMLFRDLERGGDIIAASTPDLDNAEWTFTALTTGGVGQADPMVDPVIWQSRGVIHLLSQKVGQGDFETPEDVPPQPVSLIEWTPPAP